MPSSTHPEDSSKSTCLNGLSVKDAIPFTTFSTFKSDHVYEHAISANCIQTAFGLHILGVSISLQQGELAYTTATTGVVVAF
jgi:hypothetical protein